MVKEMYKQYNSNPSAARVGDCTVRAIALATNQSWETVYIDLALIGLINHDMPSANAVWGNYLKSKGFERHIIPNTCPDCFTVENFANEHKHGTYVLALSGHVVTVIDGNWYDTWNSGSEVPVYYWERK